ncbi:hypothetical protein ACRRVB_04810 [Candidatus Cardinium hertigii]
MTPNTLSTGNLYAAFDEAGDGNRGKTTAPLLDPTRTILPRTLFPFSNFLIYEGNKLNNPSF